MSADAICNEAVALHRQGRLAEAEQLYHKALAAAPRHADANHLLGVLRHQQGRTAEAIPLLEIALAVQPNGPDMLSNYAGMLKTVGRGEEALAAYEKVLAMAPAHPGALNGRGAVLLDRNRYDEALAAYDAALAADPGFVVALANRGRALQFLGRFEEARADLERALAMEPMRTGIYLDYVETNTIKPGDTMPERMEALLARPDLPAGARVQLEFALGKAYGDLGQEKRGFGHFLKANQLKRSLVSYDEAASQRFFDRIMDVFTPELVKQKGRLKGDPSERPIFILGMMRSGSTLVEQILASHPKVAGGGELTAFILDAGRPEGALAYPDFVPGLDKPAMKTRAARYLAAVEAAAPGAERVTDKMPSNFLWAGLIHLLFPNAVILHTVRDPLDTCVSCFTKLFLEDHPHTYDLGELGRFYRRYEKLMAHWHRVLPKGRILDVRYEDVVADLEGQARRILKHCGLRWDRRVLDFHANTRPIRTASVAQVRQPLYGSAVGRARAYDEFLGPLKEALAGK